MNERQNLEDKFQRCKVCVTTQKYLCYMNRDREEAGSQKAAAMSQLLSKGRREQEKNTPTRENFSGDTGLGIVLLPLLDGMIQARFTFQCAKLWGLNSTAWVGSKEKTQVEFGVCKGAPLRYLEQVTSNISRKFWSEPELSGIWISNHVCVSCCH